MDNNIKVQNDQEEVKDTDIVFDCPECGKSLVIDYHGAGLSIPCPDCHAVIQVPIPEGMELSDLDSSVEDETDEAEIEALLSENHSLKEEVESANETIRQLVTELEELRIRRRHLERKHKETTTATRLLNQQMTIMKNALAQMQENLKELAEKPMDDTQNLG